MELAIYIESTRDISIDVSRESDRYIIYSTDRDRERAREMNARQREGAIEVEREHAMHNHIAYCRNAFQIAARAASR